MMIAAGLGLVFGLEWLRRTRAAASRRNSAAADSAAAHPSDDSEPGAAAVAQRQGSAAESSSSAEEAIPASGEDAHANRDPGGTAAPGGGTAAAAASAQLEAAAQEELDTSEPDDSDLLEHDVAAAAAAWAGKAGSGFAAFRSFAGIASLSPEEAAAFMLPPLIPAAAAVGTPTSLAVSVPGQDACRSTGAGGGSSRGLQNGSVGGLVPDGHGSSSQSTQSLELHPTPRSINAATIALLCGSLADGVGVAAGADKGCCRPHHHLIPSSSHLIPGSSHLIPGSATAAHFPLYLPGWTRLRPADAPPFLSPQQEQRLGGLHALLQGLAGSMLAQAGSAACPRLHLYWDEGDEVAAFTDGSAAWFNAARDLPPPVPPAADADPLERAEHELRMHEYDAERWRHWLAVACHLVAHCFCGPHGDRFGEALEEVQAHFRGVAAA